MSAVPLGVANSMIALGQIAFDLSDYDTAEEKYSSALEIYAGREIIGMANCTLGLARVAFRRGDVPAAFNLCYLAWRQYRHMGDLLIGKVNCCRLLGDIAYVMSEFEIAGQAYALALPLHHRCGDLNAERGCERLIASARARALQASSAGHRASRGPLMEMLAELGTDRIAP